MNESTYGPKAAPGVLDAEARRMLWHCRRGMKELDVLLERAARRLLPGACPQERATFAELLGLPDPLLAAYLLGEVVPPEPRLARLVARISALCRLDDGSAVFCR
ncbi:MAG TPA: succinate dehydrogenase assembly factor 2 [Steroidobacteraceae bacterium]|nr:succinate dehydrogenase assembly factor 2 [Steroidobacteraceae bacterium]